MPAAAPTVLVVGGGVIGLACAFRLAREGRRVTLVDRDPPGRGTSFGNAGHVATESVFPLASPEVVRGALGYLLDRDSPLRIRPTYALHVLPWLARFAWAARRASFERGVAAISALQRTAARNLSELLALAGEPRLIHLEGHLVLVERAGSLAAANAEAAQLRSRGIHADWIAAADVLAMAPDIAAPIEGAWKYRDTGHVDDPYAVSRALEQGLRASGGEVVQAEIVAIESGSNRFAARSRDGRAFTAADLVLACGAWSKPLAAQLGHRVPLDTERGYHITLPAATSAAFRIPVASFERKVIMTPMTIGVRMTGTVEFGGLELPPDPHRFTLLERHMRALAPSLPAQGMTKWMGYRPSLPDHLPVLGRAPGGRAIFAFGHQHLGLTLAGVTARLVADLVAGRDTDVDLAPFSPARFS
jgi:D-amino-acid dehydrogenase